MVETNLIDILVNDIPERVPAGSNVQSLIERFDETDPHLIVELNGRFVYSQTYGVTIVKEADRLEFINPNFGG